MKAVLSLIGLSAIAFGAGSAGPLLAQNQTAGAAADRSPAAAARTWTPRRLPDGQPDIQGVWTNYDSTPFETFDANDTPHIYAGNPSGKSTGPNAFPMDAAGRKLAKRRSLVVDPPSGRVPVQKWAEDKRDYDLARVNDSWVHQTAWERCITRGVPGGMFPAAYNAGYRILQAPGYVVILYEMIHEARVIPIDGRPHASPKVRLWNGDSRGRWEGDTLVVEVTNYNDRGNIATNIATQRIRALPQSEALRVVERFTPVNADTIEYEVTIDDPKVFHAPWKVALPLTREEKHELFEYACHEGNHGMANQLSAGRAAEREAAEAKKP
jgi:hypothetical protein